MVESGVIPLIAGTVLVTLLIAFIIFFIILYRKAQLKFQLERQRFRQALLEAEVETREHALSEISRDLHDNLGQVASLIKINLAMVEVIQPEHRVRLQESRQLLGQLIADMKSLSSSLKGENVKLAGLLNMIERDVERVKRSGFLKIDLLHKPESISLNPEISVFLYRMFQEVIHNILKHSQATRAQVSIYEQSDQLSLQVSDNGIGMEAGHLQPPEGTTGNGLPNIRERCRIIGATCSIESSPDKGTFIEIVVPT